MESAHRDSFSYNNLQRYPSTNDSDDNPTSDEEPASDDDSIFGDMSTSSDRCFDSNEEVMLNAAYKEVFCDKNSKNHDFSDGINEISFSAAQNVENNVMHDINVVTPETVVYAKGNQNSIANEWFVTNRIVLYSIDLEHGGPTAGILQLSCIAFMPDGKELGQFDQYVFPVKNTTISKETSQIHKLTLQSLCIQNAKPL